jgi:hypothetical protein
MPRTSKLKAALERALDEPENAARYVHEVSDETVETADEARLVVRLLDQFPLRDDAYERVVGSPLHDVVCWMQMTETKAVAAVFRQHAAPRLLRVFDEGLRALENTEDGFQLGGDLMFLLKAVCAYAPPGGLQRVVEAARSPLLRDGYLWSINFGMVGADDHPWRDDLIDALRDPLPEGFAGIAFLDLANTVARTGTLPRHPFDTPQGHAQLERWLLDPDPANYSYGHSAAATIPFLGELARAKLSELAARHPDWNVRLEGAWAAAFGGDDAGIRLLQQACADPRHARSAMRYLEELGASDRIPLHTRAPDFMAIAEMCEWLAHPSEFGRAPTEIAQVDARELFWPPTDDRRQLWLFRYEYPPDEGETEASIGYGMVGSVTFALFGESTEDRSPEEVYGLHCAWELEMNQDPRAPEERSAAAGMRILATYNPDFRR